MELVIKREKPTEYFVMGVLYVDGNKYCDTLEDPPRAVKIPAKTGIPAGRYEIDVTYSNRFKKPMILVKDVPGFSGVRIHGGRDEKDTEGCPLVGYRASLGLLAGGPGVSANLHSLVTTALATQKVYLTVEENV